MSAITTTTAIPGLRARARRRRCAAGAAGVVMTLLMTFPGTVPADVPNGGSGSPSVDQYVESVPSGTGDRGRARSQAEKAPDPASLPPQAQRELESGDAADRDLGAIASDPRLGAPTADDVSRADGRRDRGDQQEGTAGSVGGGAEGRTESERPEPASEATAGGPGPLWLVLGLVAMTLAAVAVTRRGRRA